MWICLRCWNTEIQVEDSIKSGAESMTCNAYSILIKFVSRRLTHEIALT